MKPGYPNDDGAMRRWKFTFSHPFYSNDSDIIEAEDVTEAMSLFYSKWPKAQVLSIALQAPS